jgi:hypothetical protein
MATKPKSNENNVVTVGQDKLIEKNKKNVKKDLFKEMRDLKGQQNFR